MVWRRSTRARSPAASRSLAYYSASWIAPRSLRGGPRGDPPMGQALGHVDDDDLISIALGDPGGQLDRLLGGLGSVNRVKRRGGQLEGRLAINSAGNTCLTGKGSAKPPHFDLYPTILDVVSEDGEEPRYLVGAAVRSSPRPLTV
jgi:hypothetical protein